MARFTSTFSLPSTIPTTKGGQVHLNLLHGSTIPNNRGWSGTPQPSTWQYHTQQQGVVRYTATFSLHSTIPTTEGGQVHLNLLFAQYHTQQLRVARFTSTFYWTSTILNNKVWSGTPQPSLCPVLSPTTEGSQVHLNLLLAQYYSQQLRVVRYTSTFYMAVPYPTTEGGQVHLNLLHGSTIPNNRGWSGTPQPSLCTVLSQQLRVDRFTSTFYMAVPYPTTGGGQVHLNLLFAQYYPQQLRVVRFTSTFYWTSTILNNKGWSGSHKPSLCPVLSKQQRVVRFTSTFSLPSTILNN